MDKTRIENAGLGYIAVILASVFLGVYMDNIFSMRIVLVVMFLAILGISRLQEMYHNELIAEIKKLYENVIPE